MGTSRGSREGPGRDNYVPGSARVIEEIPPNRAFARPRPHAPAPARDRLADRPAALSLVIEAQFYAVAPFLFGALCRPPWAAGIVVAILGYWAAYIAWPIGPHHLPIWLLLFAAGALYARAPRPAPAARLAPWSLAATVAICAAVMVEGIPDRPTGRALLLLASALFAPYVAASVARLSDEHDKRLGDLAFPLYVIHTPVACSPRLWHSSAAPLRKPHLPWPRRGRRCARSTSPWSACDSGSCAAPCGSRLAWRLRRLSAWEQGFTRSLRRFVPADIAIDGTGRIAGQERRALHPFRQGSPRR
jgi:hypothetical protein